jgi:hypothetical protein
MLKIRTYIKIILTSFLLFLFIFSCKKQDENPKTSFEYNIDGWYIDSLAQKPVANYTISFWYWRWDGEDTHITQIVVCKSDTTGYFKAIFSCESEEVKTSDILWPNDYYDPFGEHKVKDGTTHFDTIYLKRKTTIGPTGGL